MGISKRISIWGKPCAGKDTYSCPFAITWSGPSMLASLLGATHFGYRLSFQAPLPGFIFLANTVKQLSCAQVLSLPTTL